MKIISADKARKRTNKYCLLNEKRKKKKLRNAIEEERAYIKWRIELACEKGENITGGINIKHKENIDYLLKLNYSVVKTPVFYEYTVSWEEKEDKNDN